MLAAIFALILGVLLLAVPGAHSMWAYWVASTIAIAGALALIVSGEKAWEHMLAKARAAGVIAPY